MSFKIRSKITGYFSTGGTNPNFTKNGKMFADMRSVRLHYNVITTSGGRHSPELSILKSKYSMCELVEYKITEIATHEIE